MMRSADEVANINFTAWKLT